jgi:hypothetical protein
MSNYTTQIKTMILQASQDDPYKTISEKIDIAIPKIFDFGFPIWAEEYRGTLCRKILLHYFNKEICYETVKLWKLALEERLNLIMPYYNDLYRSTVLEYDPLTDIEYTETLDRKAKDVQGADETKTTNIDSTTGLKGNSTTTDKGSTLGSDFPQANYGGVDYGTDLTEVDRTTKDTTTTDTKYHNQSNDKRRLDDTKDHTLSDKIHKTGNTGSKSFAELVMKYRETLVNIDKMVIDELHDLFMLIY